MGNELHDWGQHEAYSQKGNKHMIKWATVTNVSPFNVQFDGELTASPKTYKRLSVYAPVVNDRVVFLVIAGQYLCLGNFI